MRGLGSAAYGVVRCPHCGARTLAPAAWSTVDRCPRCATPLMVPGRRLALRPVIAALRERRGSDGSNTTQIKETEAAWPDR